MIKRIDSTKLCEEWLEIKKLSIKYTTYVKYKKIIKSYIIPLFNRTNIENIDVMTVINFMDEYNNLSSSTLNIIKYILKSIFVYGEHNYLLKHIDFSYIKIQSYQETCITLTEEQQNLLSNHCFRNCDITTVAVSLALYAGLRIGEICALQWKDIDLSKGIIVISKTAQRVENDIKDSSKTKLMIFDPKTNSSKRVVTIPDFLTDYLIGYSKISNIDIENQDNYILSNNAQITEPRNIQRRFKNLCKKLGFSTNFHTLRHTFATNCISHEIDAKTVSELLGHSNISTTLNRYVHPSLEHKKNQINKLKGPKMS